METENNLTKKIGISISVIVLIGVLYVTFFLGKQSTNTTNQTSSDITNTATNYPSTTTTNTPTPPKNVPVNNPIVTKIPPIDTPKKTYLYKDGTYSATGSYMSPGGYDELGVTLILKNDIIISSLVTNMAGDSRSKRYEDIFIANYKTYVIGKNIANVYLTKVSGSSLTPKGFDDTLTQIKSQAKV